MNVGKCTNTRSPPAFCVTVHLRTFTSNKVPFHFGGRNDVTAAQVPNSPEEGPSEFCHETLLLVPSPIS
jgi:hypothetical protein